MVDYLWIIICSIIYELLYGQLFIDYYMVDYL